MNTNPCARAFSDVPPSSTRLLLFNTTQRAMLPYDDMCTRTKCAISTDTSLATQYLGEVSHTAKARSVER